MRTKRFYATFLTTSLALAFAGCEAEHKKFVQPKLEEWHKQQVGIMYQVAEQQYRVGDLDKCRESLKEALAVDAPYAPIHVLAAKVEMEGGSLDEATTHLKRALAINPADAEPLYLLGVVYQRIQKFDTALDYYSQACEKNASEARYVLATAEMQITLGKLDDAKQLLEDKEPFFEQSASMHIALARIATLQGNPALAARCYRDATMLVPDDKNVRWSYASALFDAGKYSDAARILEDMRNDPPTLPKSATALSPKATEASKASDAETDVAAAASTKASLLMMLGESYVGLKRPLDARDCFQEVIRLQPDNVSAYLSLGKTCLLTNELNITTATAQKVLRLEPDNVNAMILQAAVQQKQKNWTEAQTTLSRAARLSPKDSTVLCMQGLVALQLGQKDAATTYFTKAVAVNPDDAWANSLLEQVKPAPAPVPASPVPAAPAAVPAASVTPEPAVQAMERVSVEPAALPVQPATPPTVLATPESPTGVVVAPPEHP